MTRSDRPECARWPVGCGCSEAECIAYHLPEARNLLIELERDAEKLRKRITKWDAHLAKNVDAQKRAKGKS